MSKEKIQYKQLNTPVVTRMFNLMQVAFVDEEVRGKHDQIYVDGKEKKSAPIFSALTAFILTTAFTMRMPGNNGVINPLKLSQDEVLEKIQQTLDSIEVFLKDPDLKSDLIKCLRLYVMNGKWNNQETFDKDHFDLLLKGKKTN
tara:strand:- start:52 stop:483 length:432 start_codon:yes stop_codon:yes gene_type:complete